MMAAVFPVNELTKSLENAGLRNLVSYIQPPTQDKNLIHSIEKRANSFEFQGLHLTCEINKDLIFDLGSNRLNSQRFASVLDLDKSKQFVAFLRRKISYEINSENTGAFLIVERLFEPSQSQQLGVPTFLHYETIVVLQLEENSIGIQHVISPYSIRSIVFGPEEKEKFNIELAREYDKIIPHASKVVRGVGNQLIAWNGEQWGTASFTMLNNVILGSESSGCCTGCSDGEVFSMAKFSEFIPSRLDGILRIGLSPRYLEYQDHKSSLIIPGSMNRSDVAWGLMGGCVDWNLVKRMADKPPMAVTKTAGGDGGVSGGGSSRGGGNISSSDYYTGTATCNRQYESRDSCYGCCDTLGWTAFLGMGIVAGAAAAATCPPPFVSALCAMGALVLVGGVAYNIVEVCKDECDRTRRSLS